MKIVISTENKAKVQAVKEVLESVWNDIMIIAEKFPSDISEQPVTEQEGIEGAVNRIKNSKEKYSDADYYIGMEGFVDSNEYGMFLAGAVVIENNIGDRGVGVSGKIQLPDDIKTKIDQGEELGPLVQNLMNDSKNEIRNFDGTNGILTKGLYNRVDEFKDATKCALAKFLSSELYN
jgi:inosine/xanthosine triphosphatase